MDKRVDLCSAVAKRMFYPPTPLVTCPPCSNWKCWVGRKSTFSVLALSKVQSIFQSRCPMKSSTITIQIFLWTFFNQYFKKKGFRFVYSNLTRPMVGGHFGDTIYGLFRVFSPFFTQLTPPGLVFLQNPTWTLWTWKLYFKKVWYISPTRRHGPLRGHTHSSSFWWRFWPRLFCAQGKQKPCYVVLASLGGFFVFRSNFRNLKLYIRDIQNIQEY